MSPGDELERIKTMQLEEAKADQSEAGKEVFWSHDQTVVRRMLRIMAYKLSGSGHFLVEA